MELGGSPRETGARPRGIPGLCNHQFAYPIQFWSHSSRPPRPASPFARASRSSSFPTSSLPSPPVSSFLCPLYHFRQRFLSSPLSLLFLRVILRFHSARNSFSFVSFLFHNFPRIRFPRVLIVHAKNCSILRQWIRKTECVSSILNTISHLKWISRIIDSIQF